MVSIIIGSDSDLPLARKSVDILKEFGIEHDLNIISAHRTPEKLRNYMTQVDDKGIKVFIAMAGKAAHLAGVIASQTVLPVIGVPVNSSIDGIDALLSTVQMPKGIPVATVAIDGAENAALLALQILSVENKEIKQRLESYRIKMQKEIEEKNLKLL